MAFSPSPVPAMWTAHPDPGQGFTVATPDAWEVATRDSPTFAADLDTVGRHSPELQRFFKASLDANPELRLISADPRSLAHGFANNVNVISSDLGLGAAAPTLRELAQAKQTRLGHESGVKGPVKRAADRLAGHPAERFDYGLKLADQVVSVRSYLVVLERGGRRASLELTMAAPPDGATGIFDPITRTFNLSGA